jgi:hypothetical protein
LIVVAFEDAQLCGGTNAAGFEEFQETAVAFVNSGDGVGDAGLRVGEQEQSAITATGGAFHLTQVAVWADASAAKFGEELGFEVGGDGVLEALGFVVDLPPLHAEKFGQHAFDEVVTEGEFAGDFTAGGGEPEMSVTLDADQGIFFEATNGHGDGGRGDFQPVGEAGGDDGFSFAFGFEDGFEVVFLGDGDHWGDYTMELSVVKWGRRKTFNIGEHTGTQGNSYGIV